MLSEEIKYWFGDGEWDVDLMLRMRVVTEDQILKMYNQEQLAKLPEKELTPKDYAQVDRELDEALLDSLFDL
jgi:hypothetical protein